MESCSEVDDIDSKYPIRCCPKLTTKHLNPNYGFQKVKVKLATPVLSHTVSAAMFMAVVVAYFPHVQSEHQS